MTLYRIILNRKHEVNVVEFSPNFRVQALSHPVNVVYEDWGELTVNVKTKTSEAAEKQGLKLIYEHDGYKAWEGKWQNENNS